MLSLPHTLSGACIRLGGAASWSYHLCWSLYSPCHSLDAALASELLKLLSIQADLPIGEADSQVETFSQLPPSDTGLILILFFFFLTLLSSYPLCGDLACNFHCISFTSIQSVFCENWSMCRCIFDVFVGGGELIILFCHLGFLSKVRIFSLVQDNVKAM